jgi:Thioesterase-like superfamily
VTWADVSAVRQVGEGRYLAEVDPLWSVARKANGGYLLGTAARAAADVGGRADVLCASAVYLTSPSPGEIGITVERLRSGRTVSHVRARISQGDTACVEALLMVADLGEGAGPVWDGGVPAVTVPPIERCVRLPAVARDGTPLDLLGENDVRLDPATAGFLSGTPAGGGELRGWLALGGTEPFDTFALLYAVDALPPATFDLRPTGWVPTFELTGYVRARPAPGPLRVVQRAQLVGGGRVDEACFVWDSTGALVAQGTQLAGVRFEERRPTGGAGVGWWPRGGAADADRP